MNLIRDLEEKKNKEIVFYEGKIQGVNSEIKEFQHQLVEKDQLIFQQREDIKKMEYQMTKLKDDGEYHSQVVARLQAKSEQDEEVKASIEQQVTQQTQDYQNVTQQLNQSEQEKGKAYQEIDKLHLLVEKMEANIEEERQKRQEEIVIREQKEREVGQMKNEKASLEEYIKQKNQEM